MSVVGKKILKQLEKKKLLLLQDKVYPDIVTSLVGEPVTGSWWSHPMGNKIYNGLQWATEKENLLSVKFLSKKVCYLDKSLYPYFFGLVTEVRLWQEEKLSKEAKALFRQLIKKGSLRSDDPKLKSKYPLLKKHFDELEVALLVCAKEIHTEKGKHCKEIMAWPDSGHYSGPVYPYEASVEFFESFLEGCKLKLPWD